MSKRTFFRNNQTDFFIWCNRYVPDALRTVDSNEKGHDNYYGPYVTELEYYDALEIVHQYVVIQAAISLDALIMLEDYLIPGRSYDYNNKNHALADEIYHTWQEVCFPKNRPKLKELDSFMIGHRLRIARKENNISAQKAADLVGINPKTLYAYEEGHRMVKLEVLYKLLQIYDITMEELTTDPRKKIVEASARRRR